MPNSDPNHHYNQRLKTYAREHRNRSTKAEVRIWSELLRARKMQGYPFLRQRPILDYIADFFCKDLKLIIEIDGWTHEDPLIQERDRIKEGVLREAGYHLLRFTDYQVMYELEDVKGRIERWIADFEQSRSSP